MTSKFNLILPHRSRNLYPFPNMSSVSDLKATPTYYAYMGVSCVRNDTGSEETLFSDTDFDYCTVINHTTDFWEKYVVNPVGLEYYRTNPDDVLFGSTSMELRYDGTLSGNFVLDWLYRFNLPKEANIVDGKYVFSAYIKKGLTSSNPSNTKWAVSIIGLDASGNTTQTFCTSFVKEDELFDNSWKRIFAKFDISSVYNPSTVEYAVQINYIVGAGASGDIFSIIVDGFQVEEISPEILSGYNNRIGDIYDGLVRFIEYPDWEKLSSCTTTYFDGEIEGCSWDGARNASTSTRHSGLGGYVLNLDDDLLFPVQVMQGWGMAPIENIYSDLNYGGREYRGTVTKDSILTLTSSFLQDASTFSTDGLINLHSIRRKLIDFVTQVTNNKNLGSNTFYLLYTGATEDKLIEVQYDSGLEGFKLDGNHEVEIPLRFINPSGVASGIGYRIYPDSRQKLASFNTEKTNKSGYVYEQVTEGIIQLYEDGTYTQILDTTQVLLPQIPNITATYSDKQVTFVSIIGEYQDALYYQMGIFVQAFNRVDILIVRYANKNDHYVVGRFTSNNTSGFLNYRPIDIKIISNKLFLCYLLSSLTIPTDYLHPSVNSASAVLSNPNGKVYYLNLDTLVWDDNVFTSIARAIPRSIDYDIHGNVYFFSSDTASTTGIIDIYKNFNIFDGSTPDYTVSLSSINMNTGIIGLKNNSNGGVYLYNVNGLNIEGDTGRSDAYIDQTGNILGNPSGNLANGRFMYKKRHDLADNNLGAYLDGIFTSVVEMEDGSILVGGFFSHIVSVITGESFSFSGGLFRLLIGGGYEPILLGDDRIDYITRLEKSGDDVLVWYQPKITEPVDPSNLGSVMQFKEKYYGDALTSPFLLSGYSSPRSSLFHQGYYPLSFLMINKNGLTYTPMYGYNGAGTLIDVNSYKQTSTREGSMFISTTRTYDMKNADASQSSPSSVSVIPYSYPTLIGENYEINYEGSANSPFQSLYHFIYVDYSTIDLNQPVLAYVFNKESSKILPIDMCVAREETIKINTDINNPYPITRSLRSKFIPNGQEYDVNNVPNIWGGAKNNFRILIFPLSPQWRNGSTNSWGFGSTYLEIRSDNKYVSLD